MPNLLRWKKFARKLSGVESLQERRRNSIRGKFLELVIPKGGVGAELGVYKGHFTRSILNIVEPEKLHLVDPWYLLGNKWKWATGNPSTVSALIGILRAYQAELSGGRIVLNIGDDLDILGTFPDHYFDWVYLDTTHSYEHTKNELHLFTLKVKPNGTIAGDDWHTDPAHKHYGVCRAVKEFIAREPYELVYANDSDKQWAIRRTD